MTDQSTGRDRGAQPENQNARKHGFYSRALKGKELEDYETLMAQDTIDLDREIAMMRTKVIPAVANNPAMQHMLPRVTRLLDRLIRTNEFIHGRDIKKPRRAKTQVRSLSSPNPRENAASDHS